MARGAGAENGRRELVNGAEVIDLLERHGFEIVDMGARPLAEQVRMARSAAVLAGPHGSGMKHALFQAPRSTVIECFTPHHLNTSILNFCRLGTATTWWSRTRRTPTTAGAWSCTSRWSTSRSSSRRSSRPDPAGRHGQGWAPW